MEVEPLDELLEKLSQGDNLAAGKIFQDYAPYLRTVVRRMLPDSLRSKFDSIDILQSVWVDLLGGFRSKQTFFENAHQLRAFLIRATRNRFVDRQRQLHSVTQREIPLSDDAALETPSRKPPLEEEAQAGELWERLLVLCPPAHHDLLRMKRDGYTLAEIAEETGLHPSSVRRILYDLAHRFAVEPSN